MKYLLIGIDGSQEELFFRFNLPFVQKNLKKGVSIDLEEDLLDRGWAKICTGVKANESGAFYEKMLLDGSYRVSTNYKMFNEIKQNSNITSLWDRLNNNGLSVGIMNVPTTNMAPMVNGFFVSGGGGGAKVNQKIKKDQCYPRNIHDILIKNEYILDERLSSLVFEDKTSNNHYFFSRLKLMNEKRVDSFLNLNERFNVDFGFIVFRSIVVVEGIFASEIDRFLKGDKNVNLETISELKDFYSHFDTCLKKLCIGLNAKKIGFVSDHGTAPKYNLVNLNFFLQKLGYQSQNSSLKGFFYSLKTLKKYIPYSIKKLLKKSKTIYSGYNSIVNFNKKKTILFNINLGSSSSGIYVNDQTRFNGCIEYKNVHKIVDKFVKEFNKFEIAKKNNLVAIDYFKKKNGKYGKHFPDILIKIPNGYQVENINEQCLNNFVKPSYNSHKSIILKNVKHDLWTGTKSKKPLATFINHDFLNNETLTDKDLTSIYNIVLKEFEIK